MERQHLFLVKIGVGTGLVVAALTAALLAAGVLRAAFIVLAVAVAVGFCCLLLLGLLRERRERRQLKAALDRPWPAAKETRSVTTPWHRDP